MSIQRRSERSLQLSLSVRSANPIRIITLLSFDALNGKLEENFVTSYVNELIFKHHAVTSNIILTILLLVLHLLRASSQSLSILLLLLFYYLCLSINLLVCMTCCIKVACYPGNVKQCILYVYVLMGLKGLLLNKLSYHILL